MKIVSCFRVSHTLKTKTHPKLLSNYSRSSAIPQLAVSPRAAFSQYRWALQYIYPDNYSEDGCDNIHIVKSHNCEASNESGHVLRLTTGVFCVGRPSKIDHLPVRLRYVILHVQLLRSQVIIILGAAPPRIWTKNQDEIQNPQATTCLW